MASASLPVIKYEMTMVSMVPMVRHEIDFTILLYDFSLILLTVSYWIKKKPFCNSEELINIMVKIHLYPAYLLKSQAITHTHIHTDDAGGIHWCYFRGKLKHIKRLYGLTLFICCKYMTEIIISKQIDIYFYLNHQKVIFRTLSLSFQAVSWPTMYIFLILHAN
jgi:hypothetical protein